MGGWGARREKRTRGENEKMGAGWQEKQCEVPDKIAVSNDLGQTQAGERELTARRASSRKRSFTPDHREVLFSKFVSKC